MAGPLRVICHRDAAKDAAVELLVLAGNTIEARPVVYESRDEYLRLLAAAKDGELVLQHLHPVTEARPASYVVDRDLLVRLTDKGRLAELVAAEHLPRRRIVSLDALTSAVSNGELPVVLKAACEESLGGGDAVRICRSDADVARARHAFRRARAVVVEERLPIRSNWCVNFAIAPGEPVRYVGSAEQIVSRGGAYQGSRIAIGREPPSELVELGRTIAETARDHGYRGMAGFDIVRARDGRTAALDLNFRLNACTTALLLREPLLEGTRRRYLIAKSWVTRLDDVSLHAAVARLIRSRCFAPTGSFLPDGGERRLWGVALGDDRDDAQAAARAVEAALA